MTLAEARRVLDAEEDGPEIAAVAAGFETTAHFRQPPARIALVFPGKVTSRSKVGLVAVRTCVPIATFDIPAFAARMRDRYGEPTTGAGSLDAGLMDGEAAWSDPACAIDVRAWRKGEWFDPASGAWCVEQRVVRSAEQPAASVAEAAEVPLSTPPPVPLAPPEPASAPPARVEPAVAPPSGTIGSAASATAPVLLTSVSPRYPEPLRQRRLRARVVVRATVERDGSVGAVEVVESDRPGFGLEARVIAAVRQWRYKPATQLGTPVASEIQIPFEFQ
ncbi:MAG TPA: energy transducer TonB [Candidatus Polarisedimenticolaceae bacterium]